MEQQQSTFHPSVSSQTRPAFAYDHGGGVTSGVRLTMRDGGGSLLDGGGGRAGCGLMQGVSQAPVAALPAKLTNLNPKYQSF